MDKEVSLEELEALQAKAIEYEKILKNNNAKEEELESLKQETATLEAKKQELAGAGRAK